MVARTRTQTGLMFTFSLGGDVIEQQIANTPARLGQMAVVYLAGLGELHVSDRLDVTKVQEA